MKARVFAGGRRIDGLAADDRGVAYGDGLFETMRAHRGEVAWWTAHWARLQRGADRLRIVLPDEALVRHEAAELLAGQSGVLKLVVTRGGGGRGYAPPDHAVPTWILSTHPLPAPTPAEGIVLRWCDTRLALQPALAGIKHCNRLEQVLARAEWSSATGIEREADEGLMRSVDGDVICAIAGNLFVLRGDRWMTPRVDRCGVAGICREWIIGAAGAVEAPLDVTAVETAEAVFLCNALRGILPVARLGGRSWSLHPRTAALQAQLAASHPAFATTLDAPS